MESLGCQESIDTSIQVKFRYIKTVLKHSTKLKIVQVLSNITWTYAHDSCESKLA